MRRTRFSIGSLMGFVLIVAVGIGGLKAASPLWASACYSVAFVGLAMGVLLAIQARARKRAYWVGFSVTGWTYFFWTFILVYNSSSAFEAPPFFTSLLFEEAQSFFFPQNNAAAMATLAPTPVLLPPGPLASPSSPIPVQPVPTAAVTPAQPTQVTDESVVKTTVPPTPVPVPTAVSITPAPALAPVPIAAMQPANFTPSYVVNANGTIAASYTVNGTLTGSVVSAPTFFSNSTPELSFVQIGQSMATLLFAYLGGLFSVFLTARRERNEANPAPEVSPSSP